jgi:LPXTG-site transpeptidase (sortase) family protein
VDWLQSVAVRFSFAVRPPTDWRRRLAGVGSIIFGADSRRRLAGVALIGVGVLSVSVAGWAYFDAWTTRQRWDASPEAAALARQNAEPTPIWIVSATPEPVTARIEPLPTPAPAAEPLLLPVMVVPTPTVTVTAEQLSLEAADFRFLDPPEPGAHARLAITVANHADAPSGRVLLGIPSSWFDAYSIIGTAPAVSADRTDDDGLRTFSFPPVQAGATANFELHVTAIGEGTQAPTVTVMLDGGDTIGETATPSTFAPTPRPGPVMSIDIPRLKLHSGVVPVIWEPAPFTVGQIKTTANITQGNTVLVGHLTGAAGNVFGHLDQLKPGDEVTAVSRGLPYKFVVSQRFTARNTDLAPIQATDDARLTLMTCTGVWNPLTRDYSERLWVIAELPEQAAVTIANAAATATAQATASAATATAQATEAAATATAQATEAAQATATALAALPTPTPYAGEPAPPGGIGNTRVNLEKALGAATGETSGKLVVFRQPGRDYHVQFTPDPPRAALVAEVFAPPLSFDAAVRESRKLLPSDTGPRADAPEGNSQFIVERFSSASLAEALGLDSGDFSVIYTREPRGAITSLVLGLGDDFDALIAQSRR